MKNNIIPAIMLICGGIAIYCGIMYISYGTLIPVVSPLSLGFLVACSLYSEIKGQKRSYMLVCLGIVFALCAITTVAQIIQMI